MEIKLGTNLILEAYDEESDERFKCKVVEQQDNLLYIDYPVSTETHRTVFLVEGTRFRASFVDELKVGYAFKTNVIGRKKGNIPTIQLMLPKDEEFQKIQRREYVRVETPVDVAIFRNEQFKQYVAEDISAGGLAIVASSLTEFQALERVELTVVLPFEKREEGVRYVETTAEVTRVFERDGLIIVPMRFTETDEIDKQLIIRFCFERQLQMRKKESTI
ncbi:MAG: flagellar brake domain-containing protein [Kurthia sp.]|nr:flagellar brake domain-containing protein [Candidatus Kurthia equi]